MNPVTDGRRTAAPPDPFLAGIDACASLWARIERPVEQAAAFEALLGVPRVALQRLSRLLVASGPETEALLDGMATIARTLRNSTGKRPERRRGEVRGPIMWAETLSARASSFGADDLFVCSAPFRDFDLPENRVLAFVLSEIMRCGDDVNRMPANLREGELGRRARLNRDRAQRFLAQRGLRDVRRSRPSGREVSSARRSRDIGTYRPALDVYDRVDDPVRFEDLLPFVDRRTRVQHGVVLAVAHELARRGIAVPDFTLVGGGLRAGLVAYRHPNIAALDPGAPGMHGVLVGDVLLDVPTRIRERDRVVVQTALERRAGGRPCVAVLEAADIPAAVEAALVRHR